MIKLETTLLSQGQRDLLSPFLGQTFIWFIERWYKTYLFNNQSQTSLTIIKNYGETQKGNGCMYLDFIFSKVLSNFQYWSGEKQLLEENSNLLLSVAQFLSCKPNETGYTTLESWKNLLAAHASNFEPLRVLPPRIFCYFRSN